MKYIQEEIERVKFSLETSVKSPEGERFTRAYLKNLYEQLKIETEG